MGVAWVRRRNSSEVEQQPEQRRDDQDGERRRGRDAPAVLAGQVVVEDRDAVRDAHRGRS